jgi:cytochrome c oxidase cbb3-type subunit 2
MLSPDSVMAPYRGLFERPKTPVPIVDDGSGNRTLEKTALTERLFDFASNQSIRLTPNADGLLFVPMSARGKKPVIWTPHEEFEGEKVKIAAETEDLKALTAYVQKLGMNRGKWRDLFEPQRIEVMDVTIPRSEEWIAHGKQVYERRCLGCHGVDGDGNGPASTFMYNQRPRNFNNAVFKFRLTGEPVPTDGDLLRTISRGIRGTAMPPWYDIPLNDRLAVIQYIKYVLAVDRSDAAKPYAFFVEEPPGAPLYIGTPPPPTQQLVDRGKEVWEQAKCWECHGKTGKGDGEKSTELADDEDFTIVPADLTSGQFKSGPTVQDIYRTMTTGLSGTPMPSYKDSLPDEDRWALAYYVLALSAYTDPLSKQPLAIPEADRAALNNPDLKADTPETAYIPGQAEPKAATLDNATQATTTGE